MKTLLTRYSALAMMFVMLGLASCTEEDGIVNPPGTNDVDSLAATALSSTSIRVRWSGGTTSDQVVATPTGGGTAVTVNSSNGVATITGLTLGQTYSIKVTNADGESGALTWAPARRWPFETNGSQTVRLYSTGAPLPTQPSGLIFDASGIQTVSIRSSDSDDIDVVLAFNEDENVPVSLVSPGVDGSGIYDGKNTIFGDDAFLVDGGLDNDFYGTPIQNLFTDNRNGTDVERRAGGSAELGWSKIILVKAQSGSNVHYARIELVPQSNGQLFGEESTYEFVDLRVSYQTIPNAGYVGRPQRHGSWKKNFTPAPIRKN